MSMIEQICVTDELQLRPVRLVGPPACLQTDTHHKNYQQQTRGCCCNQKTSKYTTRSKDLEATLQSRTASVGVGRAARVLLSRILTFGRRSRDGQSPWEAFACSNNGFDIHENNEGSNRESSKTYSSITIE